MYRRRKLRTDSRPFRSENDEEEHDFVDGSRPLFDMYLDAMAKEDNKMVYDWKADADRTLVFSGLFSVIIAASLVISVRDLRSDPQAIRTFYLENISHLLTDPPRTDVPSPTQSTFSPPTSAVWVNSLWSLSFVTTLSSALLAVFVQQWARRFINHTRSPSASNPHKRAQIRAFFRTGVEQLHIQSVIDALPILLHASFIIFLAGLVLFSFGSHHTVFTLVASWVGLCAVIYAYFTLLPILRLESPYYTPLSYPLWLLCTGMAFLLVRLLRWFASFGCFGWNIRDRLRRSEDHSGRQFSHRIEEAVEESAQKSASATDSRMLLWTLQSSNEGHELERVFEGIPDLRNSKVLDEFRAASKTSNGEKMADALVGLMDRTLSSSNVFPQETKEQRIKIYNAMAKESITINRRILDRVVYKDWGGLLDSVEFGLLLRNARYSDPFAEYYSQCVVSVIISKAKERDDRWIELATGQLRISTPTLQSYLANGNSMLLAVCIFICRCTLEAYAKNSWHLDVYSRSKTLESVSRFNVQDPLPELRNEFCDMWNELVRNKKDLRSRNLSVYILKHIRNVYFELHRGTAAAPTTFSDATSDDDNILLILSSYPLCMIARHHTKSEPVSTKVDDVGISIIVEEPSPVDMPLALQDVSPAATHVQTPAATPVIDESHHSTSDATVGAVTQEVPTPTIARHAGIVSADVQSVGGVSAVSQQPRGSPLSRTTDERST